MSDDTLALCFVNFTMSFHVVIILFVQQAVYLLVLYTWAVNPFVIGRLITSLIILNVYWSSSSSVLLLFFTITKLFFTIQCSQY